jgi:hypothetical protein
MNRLDYTRTGRWRLISAAVAAAEPENQDWPAGAQGGFEVEEIEAGKWDQFAPLFERWGRPPG